MAKLIDVWRESTGQKYEFQIPDTWIEAGLAPGLTATEPTTAAPVVPAVVEPPAPVPTGQGEPPATPTPEEV